MNLKVTTDPLMRPLRLLYATGSGVHAEGICIATFDGPQVCVETADGTHIWWSAALAEASGEVLTSAQLEAIRERQPKRVTIDPEDREQVERLARGLYRELLGTDSLGSDTLRATAAALREFANPTPPIEEPTGWLAVVADREGVEWYRWSARPQDRDKAWLSSEDEGRCYPTGWSDFWPVRVLSDGVPAEADR